MRGKSQRQYTTARNHEMWKQEEFLINLLEMKNTMDSNNTCKAWSDYTHTRYGITNETLKIRTAIEMP